MNEGSTDRGSRIDGVWHVIGPGGQWLTMHADTPKSAALAAAEAIGVAGRYDVRDKDSHNRVDLFDVIFVADGGRQAAAGWRVYGVEG